MTPDDVLRIEAAMQDVLDDHLDGHARRLTEAWVRLWADVAAELEAAVLGQVGPGNVDGALPLNPRRVEAALSIVRDRLDEAVGEAVDLLTGSVPDVVGVGEAGQFAMYRAQAPDEVFNRASREQIDAMVSRSIEQITSVALPIAPDTHAAIAARLNRGVAVGDNPRLVAEQIINDVSGDVNMSLSRALNISRTEMLDAMRDAQYMTDQANAGVLSHWVWVAHLDSKTCGSCIAQHGTEWPITEPGPLDHHSGRCARVPVTRSWADLGFKNPRDTPLSIPNAEEWFTALPEEEQRGVLGRRGYEAWRDGSFPMSDWSVRKENPDWRAGYFMATPPKGSK